MVIRFVCPVCARRGSLTLACDMCGALCDIERQKVT